VNLVTVSGDRAKLAFMRRNTHKVARRPLIVQTASNIVRPFRPDDWRRQASELFHFVRDGVRFQRDPDRREQLADPRASLVRAFGDCDDKTSALTALELALGIEADIWPVWKGDELVHVQNAVRWPGSERLSNAHDGAEVLDGPPGGGWIVSDPTIAGAELGSDPRLVPRNPETGKLPLS
jgi:transglutaminase-like putative cysteine protease